MNRSKIALITGVSVLVVFIFLFWWINSQIGQQPSQPNYTEEQLRDRYDYMYTHVAAENVHPYLRPVHFKIGKNFGACGTLVLGKDNLPKYIVTANHLFSETQPGSDYYDYYVLTPKGYTDLGHVSDVVLDSLRQPGLNGGIDDVAVCHLGNPGLIARTSKVKVSGDRGFTQEYRVGKLTEKKTVTSVSSGETYPVIGQAVSPENVPFWIIPYHSMNGESGSGFWGSDDVLYVLSATTTVSDQSRKDLDIPPTLKRMTLLSAAKIGW